MAARGFVRRAVRMLAGVLVGCCPLIVGAVEVQWDFDDASLTPTIANHPTTMQFRNGAVTSDAVTFGLASEFGLPPMAGGNASVMAFPAFTPDQGLALYELGPANGGGSYINRFTMAWDVFVPSLATAGLALFQTNSQNETDADLWLRAADGALGVTNSFHGTAAAGAWHRVVAAFDLAAATPFVRKFLNGTHVGTTSLNDGRDGRWSLYSDAGTRVPPAADLFILADNNQQTAAGYISSFYYTDQLVTDATIVGWGGAKVQGIKSLPNQPDLNADGVIDIFDVNVLSEYWGTTGPLGDGNHDNIVDIFDVNLVSEHWGEQSGAGSPVPELASIRLFALLAAGAAVRWLAPPQVGAPINPGNS